MSNSPLKNTRQGAILVIVLVCVAIASITFMSIAKVVSAQRRSTQKEAWRVEATWLAESGLERAAWRLTAEPDYTGETWTLAADQLDAAEGAVVEIRVETIPEQPNRRLVHVRADYPDHPQHRSRQSKQVVVELQP